ncbi:MAG: alpha/beta hydrolase [Alphaproteobacteria bacterium]|nr:alpha/beta hydrolase [Alphaproteobacteria bacterium]
MAFATINGVRLEYQVIEASRPDTLVFLHEGLGSVAGWRGYPEKVAAATGWRALVYSRRGYGQSDPIDGPRPVGFMHDEGRIVLPALLDQLGIERPVLIGHSDGGSIALIHAGGTGRPVRGVVTMAAHVFVEDLTIAGIVDAKKAYETTDLGQRLGRIHRDPDGAFWGWNRVWLDPAFRSWNIESFLPTIACPVLAIQGLDDQYGTPEQVHAIVRGVGARAKDLLIPDCRHAPHREQEAATTAGIVDFVRGLS